MTVPSIVGLQVNANLDEKYVEIVFHGSQREVFSVRLNKRGIFDLLDGIEDLLRKYPEIHEWKSSRSH